MLKSVEGPLSKMRMQLTNVDPQLSEKDIDSARRLMKKDKNSVTTCGPILVRLKNL